MNKRDLERARKERLKLLREIEGLLSFITDPVLVVDAKGHIVHTNSAAEQMLERSQIIMIGKHVTEFVQSASLSQYIKQGKPAANLAVCMMNAKGARLEFSCRLHPLLVDAQVEGAILFFTKPALRQEQEKSFRYGTRFSLDDVIGSSPAITALKEQVMKIAKSESTVLIRGESGTGKEVLAQSIHRLSHRNKGPFVAINCAAIPEALLESELFGYEEGAFTGAKKGGKPGRFELAKGGTLFLDEIGDMPLYLQAKLLRVLQERRIERVGGTKSIEVDVRIIAATHKDLESMIANNQFREDLYFRLNVIPLYVPPLRERKEDLYELIQYYMHKFCKRFGKEPKRFSSQALKKIFDYHWPGNIRELENMVEYIVNLEIGDLVTVSSLPAPIREMPEDQHRDMAEETHEPQTVSHLSKSLYKVNEVEEQLIIQALQRFGTSTEGKRKAAEALGISLATLYRKLEKMKRRR
ncbi:sigma-54 interaction domain-containing protein [Parageobacillus thermoglucosidasius]|uniref:sigma-54 interaction domain-containing protein n=1 Tax=Parageobacillus thermoglucosidasius TaxID=1426 RepID=UPI0001D18E86|nr:sigma-54-dependent Fis family transcriptional regulator [Parageobacillus thermoglucosidasius]AEH49790.1 PAS modulated sigma54 specific transcriptional regulator, Fis family [Parageobacillus thermoglucosidasius C56-YS93]MED4904035.1 sigma-54-dependent Fis family transcriptional regulator [Parageobacillus thermoglucosidasius]MED4914936.1 sigma-54-dependent Fis family transcriptional regulator [Parageobacillus thermoglucosidasius]MED4943756.1 sigma-54-dependent Fis family transcriptional regula